MKTRRLKVRRRVHQRVALIVALFMFVLMVLSQISTALILNTILSNQSDQTLKDSVESNVSLLDDWLQGQADRVSLMCDSVSFANNETTAVLEGYLATQLARNDSALMYYIGSETAKALYPADGSVVDLDPTTRGWWTGALENDGEPYFTDPYVDAITGNMVISIAQKTTINNNIYVVLADINLTTVTDIVSTIGNDSTRDAFLLTATDTVITHQNPDYLPEGDQVTNLSEVLDIDFSSEKIQSYTDYDGVKKSLLTKTLDTTGWKLGVSTAYDVVFQSFKNMMMQSAAVMITFLIIFTIIILLVLRYFLSPVAEMTRIADQVAHGDFSEKITVKRTRKDDIGLLQQSLISLTDTLNHIVDDTNRILGALGNYDLTVEDMGEYPGEFNEMSSSINNVKHILRSLLTSMYGAARSVDDGSSQFAAAAESLSLGATTQASSISTLEIRMGTMADSIESNAKNCNVVHTRLNDLNQRITDGNTEMKQLFESVEQVESMSEDISKIVSAIDTIAFQTNILALNAAVEAARAGENGKGFAVVADEVRSLAARCAEESSKTAELIQGCITSIAAAKEHADVTLEHLNEVLENSNEINQAFDSISKDTADQAADAEEIRSELKNISDIVQTNTAASEETAASSQELSSQAQALSNTVSRFKLES